MSNEKKVLENFPLLRLVATKPLVDRKRDDAVIPVCIPRASPIHLKSFVYAEHAVYLCRSASPPAAFI